MNLSTTIILMINYFADTCAIYFWDRHGHDRLVVGLTTAYHH